MKIIRTKLDILKGYIKDAGDENVEVKGTWLGEVIADLEKQRNDLQRKIDAMAHVASQARMIVERARKTFGDA